MSEKKVTSVECRFAVYSKSKISNDDIHLIKERINYEDGTSKPNVRIVHNYKQDFYVTNKGNRNHKEFKEWEDKSKLIKYQSTRTNLTSAVAAALGQPGFRGSLRDLCKQPYVYGVDLQSTSAIKQKYLSKTAVTTPYSNAAFDTETDVINGTGEILMATLSFKERIITVVQKSFLSGHTDAVNRIHKAAEKYIGDILKPRNVNLEVILVDSEIEVVKTVLQRAHQWQPDFVSVWSITFDMDKILEACERAGVDPAEIMSDPSVPPEYRSFKFKKGLAKKAMASGRILNYKPSQQWHTVFCPSSFYWIDAMCAYRQVRGGAPEEANYSLDYILKKNKLGGKLKFEAADGLSELDWHVFMQKENPIEYVIYNIYDCVGMELLDEKTLDLQLSLPMFAGCTDFKDFPSLPKKAMNELHFFIDEFNKVPGATASEMTIELDEDVTDISNWIVMLPSHNVYDNGLNIIKENPLQKTNIRVATADLDIAGAYPTNQLVCNVSKSTTSKELVSIDGIDEHKKRMATINWSGGKANAVEFVTSLYGAPELSDWLAAFNQSKM